MLIWCRDICFKCCCKKKTPPLKSAYYPKGLGNKKSVQTELYKRDIFEHYVGGEGGI